MKWIYYIAQHGGGHQATTDGFVMFGDDFSDEDITERVDWQCRELRNCIYRWWEVPHPTLAKIEKTITSLKSTISRARESLKDYKKMERPASVQEDGADESFMKAIVGVIGVSFLAKLHSKGIIVSHSDVYAWRRGKRKPLKSIRRKVMNAIKSADKFPSYA